MSILCTDRKKFTAEKSFFLNENSVSVFVCIISTARENGPVSTIINFHQAGTSSSR